MSIKKEYLLEGLECSGCAAKIESAVKKAEGISSASLNPVNSKLTVEIDGNFPDNLHAEISKIVHKYEPEVRVLEKSAPAKQPADDSAGKLKSLWLITGTAAFLAGMLFQHGIGTETGEYIALALFAFSYLLTGLKVLIRMVRNIAKGLIFDESFLMGVATLGAVFVGEYSGAAAVMVFYQVGEFFQELAVAKSKRNIAALMDIRPDYANLQIDGRLSRVSPENVNIGDVIVVKPGEKIPLDGIVTDGWALLDTSSLTGESVPRKASVSDKVLSGCINQNGVLTVEVTQTFGESTVSKIIDLVENAAEKKAVVETFITKFARYYTPVVMALALLIAVVPPLLFDGAWFDWIYRSLVLLIIACPCALVLSIPLGFFAGIGAASGKGILVKGGNYLEALAGLDVVVFDKTGTLTKGVFKVTSLLPANGFSESELLESAAFAESFSSHPIALSIINEYGKEIDKDGISQYVEIAGHGVSVYAHGKAILAGNEKLMDVNGIGYPENNDFGTKVYVAIDNVYAGCVIIADEIRADSGAAISGLKALGVRKTVMLTGDVPAVARAVANETRIDEAYAGLLPWEKVERVQLLKEQMQPGKALAFVGDGVNDAPVLAMADVGVAMGGLGSDAAIEAADIVLMTDEPAKLVEAVKVARFTNRIVWQNIIFALGVQIVFLFLGTMGVASIWEAIFADVGVSLIAVMNTWRIPAFR